MKLPTFRSLTNFFVRHLPLVVVIAIALTVSFQNIHPTKHYAGWDNILAEFDVAEYARQVLFGAWSEHQGLGAPSAQGQLSEIPRLPLLFLLHTFLPAQLIRYVFIFGMFVVGGVSMYFYLNYFWIKSSLGNVRNWLAGLGASFYLLHILTLQQFYIAFEMFMVQFAFLPLLLISVHYFANVTTKPQLSFLQSISNKVTTLTTTFRSIFQRNSRQPQDVKDQSRIIKFLLLFLVLQLFIAPSGHTPTVFYLAVLFSQLYAFFIVLPQGLWKAVKAGFIIGVLTFLFNAYWIVPNLYYSIHDSRYVQESHDNRLFGPESVWSVREAGNISNFLKGTHYLFTWKDYSFERKEFDFIFNDWQQHLETPLVSILLHMFGIITVLGFFFCLFDTQKGSKRWAIILFYLGCLSFIWIDLFPTSFIFDTLYQSGSFLEAFRNPFTKLSILYSFVCITLFIQYFETLFHFFLPHLQKKLWQNLLGRILTLITLSAIIYTALPSFQGHFISEKLQIQFPDQYTQMFEYLKTRDRNLRVLQLPQLSHAGWEYYDWQFLGKGNGYQGMGFYFFGMPQPQLARDSDRWIETSDFFYHELKHAVDTHDIDRFVEITEKYQVNLVIVDETRIEPHRSHDYAQDHLLLTFAGFNKVWQKDFLTIYERVQDQEDAGLIVPSTVQKVSHSAQRVRTDVAYQQATDYIQTTPDQADIIYPFADVLSPELSNTIIENNTIAISKQIEAGNYNLTIPGVAESEYFTPIAISYIDNTVSLRFPELEIQYGQKRLPFPTLEDLSISLENTPEKLILFFNNKGVILEQGKTSYPVIPFTVDEPVLLEYSEQVDNFTYTDIGLIDGDSVTVTPIYIFYPDWERLKTPRTIPTAGETHLKVMYHFPVLALDPFQNPSVNCSTPLQGNISRRLRSGKAVYYASNFGVNCNGYGFADISPAFPYVLKFTGRTIQGRGIKVFINYSDPHVLPDDYLLHDQSFNRFITVPAVSKDNDSTFYLNWEVRSFGKESINELEKIQLLPFPLDQVADIALIKTAINNLPVNKLEVLSRRSYVDSIHVIDATCQEEDCYIALNQSYDDMWLAFDKKTWSILPHYRFNNWSNAWQVDAGIHNQIVIIYIPEVIALFCLIILIVFAIILGITYSFKYYVKTRNHL